jgi:hypothetical protein
MDPLSQTTPNDHIASPPHGHFHQGYVPSGPRLGEPAGLYAREFDRKPELGKLDCQEILHALGTRVVLAIDDVQHTEVGPAVGIMGPAAVD